MLRRFDDAVGDAKEAVSLQPTWPKGWLRYGAALFAAGAERDALAALDKAAWLAKTMDAENLQQFVDVVAEHRERTRYAMRPRDSADDDAYITM